MVFVRHALPGERVRALVTEEHAAYLRADAVEILDASPRRVTPPCPWAGPGLCGGCDLQHADLGYQRELKAAVVREQLIRLGGLSVSTVDNLAVTVRPLPTVAGEPDGLGWRTRVQYTVDSTGRAGLLAHRSHEVVPVDRCLIAHASIRAADVLPRSWPEHDEIEVIRGEPATVLARRADAPAELVDGAAVVTERAVGRTWRLPPTAFWQVHPSAADTLATAVVDLLAPWLGTARQRRSEGRARSGPSAGPTRQARSGDRIWDLYGGAGLFAAALAPHVDATAGERASQGGTSEPGWPQRTQRGPGPSGSPRITVVEADAVAVAAARENLRDLTTVTVVHSAVAKALRNPRWRGVDAAGGRRVGGPDVVVLDPPRSGAGREVVTAVAARGPRAVAYVACDPAALARDVGTFRTQGYELVELRAYDLFPQTHHVECVALLIPS